MRRNSFGATIVALVCLVTSTGASGAESVWSQVRAPTQGPALAIGGYSGGCVQGARELPAPVENSGYAIMKPERRRMFGHPQLVDFVVKLGAQLAQRKLGPLAVGDLGQARGGPAPNGHASHQSGLDVDLWYVAATPGAQQYSVVDLEAKQPNAHWSERIPVLLELAASDPRVARIFVNALVKRQLCEAAATSDAPGAAPRSRAWLSKLRPWWGHNEHFHVRLACPESSPECQPQPPLPSGDGCEEVAWWLSPESAQDRSKGVEAYQKKVGALPKLPDSCKKVAAWAPSKARKASAAPAVALQPETTPPAPR